MQTKSAAKFLQLWAYFDNQNLRFELLAAGGEDIREWLARIFNDELSFMVVIRLLNGHALIESVKDFGGYGIHTCVHAWAVNLLNFDWEISMA